MGKGKGYNLPSLVNQTTPMDIMGDSFRKQAAKSPNITAKQRSMSGFMDSIGAGMQMQQASERNEKLERLEEYEQQLAQLQHNLVSQTGKKQLYDDTLTNLANDNKYDLQRLNELRGENSPESLAESEEISRNLFTKLMKDNPDMVGKYEKLSHIRGDKVYFDDASGKSIGLNIKDALAPLISKLPEEEQRNLVNLQTSTTSKRFSEADRMRNAEIQDKEFHAYLNEQHAKRYESERLNPNLTPSQLETKKVNQKRLNGEIDKVKGQQVINQVYDEILDVIASAEKKGIAGPGLKKIWERQSAKFFDGNANELSQEEMIKYYFAGRSKELGGANVNQKEFEVAMNSIPSISHDTKATRDFIKREKERFTNDRAYVDKLTKHWGTNQYQGTEYEVYNQHQEELVRNKTKEPIFSEPENINFDQSDDELYVGN